MIELLDIFLLLRNQVLQRFISLVVQLYVLLVCFVILNPLLLQLILLDLRLELKSLRLRRFNDLVFLVVLSFEKLYLLLEFCDLVLEYLYRVVLLE